MTSGKCLSYAALSAVLTCAGCAVPKYDVPYDETSGQPTVTSIINRVKCELTDMVRAPLTPGSTSTAPLSGAELFLLNGDYDVVVTLTLEVNNTGGLTPSITFMEPLSKLTSFSFGGTATLSESRDHTFTDNFQLSIRQLYADAQMAGNPSLAPEPGLANHPAALAEFAHRCPKGDTNLSEPLGIADFVGMGAQTERLPLEPTAPAAAANPKPGQAAAPTTAAATQAFGGTVSFVVTKNVTALGPTWTTTRWKGPGGLVGLSHVNTDKIVVAFAQGPHAGQPLQAFAATPPGAIRPNGPNVRAYNFLQQQITQSINSQLQLLLNGSP